MNLQIKSSLITLLIAVVSIYFFSSLKAEAKQVSEQINEKIVELEKSLDDIRNILGTSKKDSI